MKSIVTLFLSIFCLVASAQVDPGLAKTYFEKGAFEKAASLYKKLLSNQRTNSYYSLKLIECYQQLSQFKAAQNEIEAQLKYSNNPQYFVELGYNYQLQDQLAKAEENYKNALERIDAQPNYVYAIAQQFESHGRIDNAIQAYELGLELAPNPAFYYQLAVLHGVQKNIEKMMEHYLDYVETNSAHTNQVMRLLAEYISEDASQPYNQIFKKVLLKKLQSTPNTLWNQWLSWLYIQQNDFKKAFVQEKAVFRREPESLQGLINLAMLTKDAKAYETALTVLEFITQNTTDSRLNIQANTQRLELQLEHSKPNYNTIKASYVKLLDTYKLGVETLEIQLSYATFLAFYDANSEAAITFLKTALKANLTDLASSSLKMKLADILVTQNKFNQALIYYTQIQLQVKNSTLAQEARFKAAKTSYYKGDFDWAETQLKVLKSSTSQLTANDALDLQLLISDHIASDSLHTALKMYAKAELLSLQKKSTEAIGVLETILENHKTDPIIDQTLFVQARLYESEKMYSKAEANYMRIITDYKDDILVDDAYFYLAELYRLQLNQIEKATLNYETIIFNHEDSIHFVDARKQYRILRGDTIN
jgi:tetratricopeptide (TPR) repeat protein